MKLVDLVLHRAQCAPASIAVKGSDGMLTYRALDRLASRFARALASLGVQRGDRVGFWLEKSTYCVAAMQGILRLGAIYVPLDPLSPAARIATIACDCMLQVVITSEARASELRKVADLPQLTYLCLDDPTAPFNWQRLQMLSDAPCEAVPGTEDDIAYILYTSGSTGIPKGVCISNRNALAFVAWAAEELAVTPADNLANHAPFHFDLSVFDLYAAFLKGASVCLIPDGFSYISHHLVRFLINEAITVWYSVPSALILMMEQGALLDLEHHCLRAILFAGEPFPLKPLRNLYERWSCLRLLNLYGPTETNVCTFYEMTGETDLTRPLPIGRACSGDTVWAQKADGTVADPGEEGELLVSGPTVMVGYWGQPVHGPRPYATGDLVRLQPDGNYLYLGRLDHIVKVRGHRIELGDIEATLATHPSVREVAVIVTGSGMQSRLLAFVVPVEADLPALLELKRYCAERLPRYMIIDAVQILSQLPRTRNGKIDHAQLAVFAYDNSNNISISRL